MVCVADYVVILISINLGRNVLRVLFFVYCLFFYFSTCCRSYNSDAIEIYVGSLNSEVVYAVLADYINSLLFILSYYRLVSYGNELFEAVYHIYVKASVIFSVYFKQHLI